MFYYTHDSNMYVPQYVSPGAVSQHPAHWMFHWRFPVTKKKVSNNDILQRGTNIMKTELQISYTNIILQDVFFYQIPLNK
jgi:hypothetical protein